MNMMMNPANIGILYPILLRRKKEKNKKSNKLSVFILRKVNSFA